MFTFGYKTTLSSILRSLASIGIGLVMIFDNEASETVVKVVAAFLFASGLVSLVYGLIRNKKEGLLPLMAVNAVVDILIGVLLFLNPGWVAGFIITLIGIVLILFGGLQLLALAGTLAQARGKQASCSVNVPQAVIQLQFSDAPEPDITIQQANEGEAAPETQTVSE